MILKSSVGVGQRAEECGVKIMNIKSERLCGRCDPRRDAIWLTFPGILADTVVDRLHAFTVGQFERLVDDTFALSVQDDVLYSKPSQTKRKGKEKEKGFEVSAELRICLPRKNERRETKKEGIATHLGTVLLGQLGLLLGGRGADDVCAEVLGHLAKHESDTAGCCVDEDPVAALDWVGFAEEGPS